MWSGYDDGNDDDDHDDHDDDGVNFDYAGNHDDFGDGGDDDGHHTYFFIDHIHQTINCVILYCTFIIFTRIHMYMYFSCLISSLL